MKISHSTIFAFLFTLSAITLTAQYTTNGSAVQLNNSCTRLTSATTTQNGSAFFNTPVDLSEPFDYNGTMYFGNDDAGADGLAFVLATDVTAQGMSGGGIGYEGIIPSVAVEFDTWQNADFFDPPQDHMGIMSGGVAIHNTPTVLADPVLLPNIEDGEDHCFRVRWDPAVPIFEATLDDVTITYEGDITTFFPPGVPVYYGYTGSTGGSFNEQTVCIYNTDAFGPLTLEGPDLICQNDGIQTFVVNVEGGVWDFSANEQGQVDPSVLAPGLYTVGYTLGAPGCEVLQFKSFNVLPAPQVEAEVSDIDCNQATGGITVMVSGGLEPYTYAWSTGENDPFLENLAPGIYTLTVTGNNDCETVTDFEIFATDVPQIAPLAITPGQCNSENVIEDAGFSAEVSGGTPPYTYSIDDSEATQVNNTFTGLTQENGTLTVTDAVGCTAILDYTVPVAQFPEPAIAVGDNNLCNGPTIITIGLSEGETVLWSTGETTEEITVETADTIEVTITNEFNCSAVTTVAVNPCEGFEMPNIFTPNGDGVNDTFGPVSAAEGQDLEFTLKIYSRWGDLVYEGSENWDGNADGKPFPADVLVYTVEVETGEERVTEKGDVTLVR